MNPGAQQAANELQNKAAHPPHCLGQLVSAECRQGYQPKQAAGNAQPRTKILGASCFVSGCNTTQCAQPRKAKHCQTKTIAAHQSPRRPPFRPAAPPPWLAAAGTRHSSRTAPTLQKSRQRAQLPGLQVQQKCNYFEEAAGTPHWSRTETTLHCVRQSTADKCILVQAAPVPHAQVGPHPLCRENLCKNKCQ